MKYLIYVLLAIVFIPVTVDGNPLKLSTATPAIDTASQNFVTKAAEGGMMEVEAGKLAVKNAGDAGVKAFGAKMIADHGKANAELKAIALTAGYKLPGAAPKKHLSMMVGQRGSIFDKHYISMMLKDHDKTIGLFEKAAASVPDAKLRVFAAKTLPVLREHKRLVIELAAKLGIK